jgi:hypothetical protein
MSRDLAEHRALWQGAWGVMAAVVASFLGLLIPSRDPRLILIPVTGVALLVCLYCVFAPVFNWPPFRRHPSPPEVQATDFLEIDKATYGFGTDFVDVTPVVRAAVRSDRLYLFISNATFGLSPTPGVVNHLSVTYRHGGIMGHERRAVFADGDAAVLPPFETNE